MKKLIKVTIFVVVFILFSYYIINNYQTFENKIEYLYIKYFDPQIKQTLVDSPYRKKVNYEYLYINTNTKINSKDELKNVIYTFFDAGWDKYTVKCNPDYLTCTEDIKEIINNNTYLTDISNFVHPFNTFENINTTFTNTGKVTFSKKGRYTEDEIKQINDKVDEIYNSVYDKNKNKKENIKLFHDYIINNTRYDVENKTGKSNYKSSTSYGVLLNGYGICSGYSDAMNLFLDKMGIKNYRISSENHEWNLVYIEGNWLHLDLTWDDPIVSDGSDTLKYDYFLITTDELKEKNDGEHIFNENIYLEALKKEL